MTAVLDREQGEDGSRLKPVKGRSSSRVNGYCRRFSDELMVVVEREERSDEGGNVG